MSLYAKLAALLALIALGFGIHWHGVNQGKKLERVEWQAKEIARQQSEKDAILAAVENNRLIQKANDAKNRSVSNDYENRLAVLRKNSAADRATVDAAGGLRITSDVCKGAPAGTETAGDSGRDETTSRTVKLPDKAEEFLWSEADRADEIVEQARTCQNWIKAHGFYGP